MLGDLDGLAAATHPAAQASSVSNLGKQNPTPSFGSMDIQPNSGGMSVPVYDSDTLRKLKRWSQSAYASQAARNAAETAMLGFDGAAITPSEITAPSSMMEINAPNWTPGFEASSLTGTSSQQLCASGIQAASAASKQPGGQESNQASRTAMLALQASRAASAASKQHGGQESSQVSRTAMLALEASRLAKQHGGQESSQASRTAMLALQASKAASAASKQHGGQESSQVSRTAMLALEASRLAKQHGGQESSQVSRTAMLALEASRAASAAFKQSGSVEVSKTNTTAMLALAASKAASAAAAPPLVNGLTAKQLSEAEEFGDGARNAVEDAAAADVNDHEPEEVLQQYQPAKLKDGLPHPDPVIESSSLASIEPPDIWYHHHLQDIVAAGTLSGLQLESVVYAFQRFEGQQLPGNQRAGFFLGDGTGVGKGRQIAGTMVEHWRTGGRRILWLSVSNDLKWDAERDLKDLGANEPIPIFPVGSTALPSKNMDMVLGDGMLFATYSLLVSGASGRKRARDEENASEDGHNAICPGSRLEQIYKWLQAGPPEQPALLIFDECHKAKNLLTASGKASKTASAVVQLQKALPQARVLYCSATGAAQPQNLAYMTRLGTWGYEKFHDFKGTLETAGMGAMEMFSMGLKATGAYCCRALSYKGAEFKLSCIDISPQSRLMYDRATCFWSLLYRVFQSVERAKEGVLKVKFSHFWGAHLRFFRQMLMAAKVPHVAHTALEAVREEQMSVVIGLQSTGEANMSQARADMEDDELDDFISAPRVCLQNLLEMQFTALLHAASKMKDHTPLDGVLVRMRECAAAWRREPCIDDVIRAEEAAAQKNTDEADDDDVVMMTEKSKEEVQR
ncbi:hypothetical protein CYMTET_9945 [Cymbomonas tetramitiformis]|uniref:Strawberry notch AAA domain-containing protein n=1 Tax=Cymbomonas tetramitiformis TaxID=36881 RepID=A0AAE0LEY8_9CHLO|nr:hypothetical protein CYMTET_9945 [Cymbomonas tetramitiformis]